MRTRRRPERDDRGASAIRIRLNIFACVLYKRSRRAMNANMTVWLRASALATLLTISLASMLPVQIAAAANGMDMTKAATPAENESWAAKLDKEAADDEVNAADHTANASRFHGMAAAGSKQAISYTTIANHCEALAKKYHEAAKEARAMAALHRDLAKGG